MALSAWDNSYSPAVPSHPVGFSNYNIMLLEGKNTSASVKKKTKWGREKKEKANTCMHTLSKTEKKKRKGELNL